MLDVAVLIGLGLAIGLVLGGLGGGGAVLAVPALVFLVGQSAAAATTSSLVIVGLSALVGAVAHLNVSADCCRIAWRIGLTLALTGIPATWVGSQLNHIVDEHVLLLAFALFMLAAAAAMWPARTPGRPRPDGPQDAAMARPMPGEGGGAVALEEPETAADLRPSWPVIIATGTGMGLLTGFFGAGGGFVIVPLLVVVFGLPVNVAAGTSLVVVALNSVIALLARSAIAEFDWAVIVPFSLAAMAASVVARRAATRLPARQLRRGFAVLLVLVAGYTGVESLLQLT